MMKVLFLDIDGVLNRQIPDVSLLGDEERQKPDGQNEEIEEDKMALLSRLVRETGAVVVLHSGWRFRFDENGNPLHPAAKRLCSLMQSMACHFMGSPPIYQTRPFVEPEGSVWSKQKRSFCGSKIRKQKWKATWYWMILRCTMKGSVPIR